MTTPPKRPLLPREDRTRLRSMAERAGAYLDSPQRAYVQAVRDTLFWLLGEDMAPLFKEVTR